MMILNTIMTLALFALGVGLAYDGFTREWGIWKILLFACSVLCVVERMFYFRRVREAQRQTRLRRERVDEMLRVE